MNKIINDYGQETSAVGADGSLERVKAQYPKLIQIYSYRLTDKNYCDIFAHDDLERQEGFKSKMERENIIAAAKGA